RNSAWRGASRRSPRLRERRTSMILVVANPQDSVARQLATRCSRRQRSLAWCSESDVFSIPFSFVIRSEGVQGTLYLRDQLVHLSDLDGVFLRLSRDWWPGPEFEMPDQVFVYHETMASWFALLDGAPCPVINRFGLGWWVQDSTYLVRVRAE